MIFKNNAGKIFVLNIEETKLVEIFVTIWKIWKKAVFTAKKKVLP